MAQTSFESAKTIITDMWEVFKSKFSVLWPLALLSFIVPAIQSLRAERVTEGDVQKAFDEFQSSDGGSNLSGYLETTLGVSTAELTIGILVILLISFLYQTFVQGATIRTILDLLHNKDTEISFGTIVNAGQVNWVRMMTGFLVVGAIVMAGLLLLVIPGIVAMILLAFTFHIMVDKDLGVIEAMKHSNQLVKNNFAKMLMLTVLLIAVAIVTGIVVGIVAGIFPYRLELLTNAYSAILGVYGYLCATKLYLNIRN